MASAHAFRRWVGCLGIAWLGAGLAPATAGAALLVQYLFDQPASAVSPLDSSLTALDSTPNALHLKLKGAAAFSNGALAINSTGQSGYAVAVSAAAGNVFDNLQRYTITGWYNDQGSATPNGRLMTMGNSANAAYWMQLSVANGTLGIQCNAGPNYVYTQAAAFPADGWTFFAVTVDATASSLASAVAIYQGTDGAPLGAPLATSHSTGTAAGMALGDIDTIAVGNAWNAVSGNSGNPNRSMVTATLADVRVYAGVLSPGDLEGVRASRQAPLLARFRLDEGAGTTVADAAGNAGPLTLYGAMAANSGAAGWTAADGGTTDIGAALYNPAALTSTHSGVSGPSGPALDHLQAYTVTGWYNDLGSTTAATSNGRLVTLGNSGDASRAGFSSTTAPPRSASRPTPDRTTSTPPRGATPRTAGRSLP